MTLAEILDELWLSGLYDEQGWLDYESFFRLERDRGVRRIGQPNALGALAWRVLLEQSGFEPEADRAISPTIITLEQLTERCQGDGILLGVVSGCYDLLHQGHLQGFRWAREHVHREPLGRLCAFVLNDAHIQKKKGQGRPVLNLNERLRLIAGCHLLDYIVVLDDGDCRSSLHHLRPRWFFKSAEDLGREVVAQEAALVASMGGRVECFPETLSRKVSTTGLIESLRRRGMTNERREPLVENRGFPSQDMRRFPNIVNVEVLRGSCPCQCVHCPVGRTPPQDRSRCFGAQGMELALYDKITKEVGAHPWSTVRVHAVGEPLLWPELIEALRTGKRNGARTWVFTCGVAGQSTIDAFCENADIVEVSVNSIDRQDYLATKGIDAFEAVVANIARMRARQGSPTRFRLIASRTQSPDQDADAAFVRYWEASRLVDAAFVRGYHTYNDLLPAIEARGDRPPGPCLVHWARFNIAVDGRAVLCFNELFRPDVEPSLVLGNVGKESISSIWAGAALDSMRRAELTRTYGALPDTRAIPCKQCRYCQPIGGATSETQVAEVARGASRS
jgi:cytidyltransferase-like protein